MAFTILTTVTLYSLAGLSTVIVQSHHLSFSRTHLSSQTLDTILGTHTHTHTPLYLLAENISENIFKELVPVTSGREKGRQQVERFTVADFFFRSTGV
jgi:vacuolar-type H+-ATPase subunit F/Vma7